MSFYEGRSGENLMAQFADLFVPDLLTPEQFFDAVRRECSDFEGERRMLREMLLDAIECWQRTAAIGIDNENYFISLRERLHREADFWIFGKYNSWPFFSFAQTCDYLGLDPDCIRRRLLKWRRGVDATRHPLWASRTGATEGGHLRSEKQPETKRQPG